MESLMIRALSEATLSVEKFENLVAREEWLVEIGKQGTGERERSEFILDHSLQGLNVEVEIRFLK